MEAGAPPSSAARWVSGLPPPWLISSVLPSPARDKRIVGPQRTHSLPSRHRQPHKLAASRVSSCRSRRALTFRPSRAREVRSGVDRIAAPPPPVARAHHHLEVQMRLAPMSVPSRADGANHLAADETGVLRKPVTIRIQMGVVVDEMFALVGCIYREPTLAVPLQSEHTPIVSGQDRCSAWCGDVDGAVDMGSAARRSKVVGYLIWRHARHGHHELPCAERTAEGPLASWGERAPRDLKCNERQRAPSAPSPVHLTAPFAIASVRAPRRRRLRSLAGS